MAILSVGFQRGSHIDTGVLFNKKKKRIKTGGFLRLNLINNNLDKGVLIPIKTAFNGINADFISFFNTFFITFANEVSSQKGGFFLI